MIIRPLLYEHIGTRSEGAVIIVPFGFKVRMLAEYNLEVKRNPVTDGVSHYVAPLEELGEPIWEAAGEAMRSTWNLEVWGDFWVLTTLSQDAAFMAAVRSGAAAKATRRAKALGLWHLEIVRIEE